MKNRTNIWRLKPLCVFNAIDTSIARELLRTNDLERLMPRMRLYILVLIRDAKEKRKQANLPIELQSITHIITTPIY